MVALQNPERFKENVITALGVFAGLALMAYGREQMWKNKDEARAVAQERSKKFKELVTWRRPRG